MSSNLLPSFLIGLSIVGLAVVSCTPEVDETDTSETDTTDTDVDDTGNTDVEDTGDTDGGDTGEVDEIGDGGDPDDITWDDDDVVHIVLADGASTADGEGVAIDGDVVTVVAPGTYAVTGSLGDGQLGVDTAAEGTVRLLLDGVQLANDSTAPLFVASADRTVLYLVADSVNTVTDGPEYTFADGEDEPNAAVFAKDDLRIYGTGSLVIDASYNDGLASKDTLAIFGGNVVIDAVDDGARGKDQLVLGGGALTVTAGGDGLKSDNEEDDGLGIIDVRAGVHTVVAGADGLDAVTSVLVSGGTLTVTAGGGADGSASDSKGLKADALVQLDGGTIVVDASDDAVHSNGDLLVDGADIQAATGDDGLHADGSLEIASGSVVVSESYEAIEAQFMTLSGGDIRVSSSDDAVNAAGDCGADGRRAGTCTLDLTGARLAIYADGDGIDANGSVRMTAGTALVHGPTASMNGPLDYDGDFPMDGGLLVAGGSSRMAQAPDSSSSQDAVLVTFGSTIAAGTVLHVVSDEGDAIVTFAPAKRIESLAISSPDLERGVTYRILAGGASTGDAVDGLYTGGTYSGGSSLGSFTVNSTVTTVRL